MPPANPAVIASAGVIAVSIAVAAAIAVYESPELRRMADDLRRRIAIALHSLGDGVEPPTREPMFNRPEDAEGFMLSRGAAAATGNNNNEIGVDADEASRRRQREELMYWNAVLAEKQLKMKKTEEEEADNDKVKRESSSSITPLIQAKPASTFDDFLRQDASGEQGTFVYNTGVEVRDRDEGILRRRGGGTEGVRGLNSSIYANPFADEHGIDDFDDEQHSSSVSHPLSPGNDEIMSDDIYNATEPAHSQTLSPRQPIAEVLFDHHLDAETPAVRDERPSTLLERELSQDEFMTAGQDDRHDAYASIQAWAQNSNPNFYSPLPMSPPAPLSEPEVVSVGALTPTDSSSLAGSGEDVGHDGASSKGGDYDVLSESEDGTPTPTSWTEVGSVVSEGESAVHS